MIDDAMLAEAATLFERQGMGEAGVAALRKRWPGLRFVACSEDDIPARLPPAHEAWGFKLYLVGNGDHCLALTRDAETAIGMVLARVEAE